jgi:integrase
MNTEKFSKWCKGKNIRPKTLEKYLYCLDKIPDDILDDPIKLKEWIDNAGEEPTVMYTIVAAIRTYYKKSKQDIDLFSFPKLKEKKDYDWLLTEQISTLYDCCTNDKERLIIRLLLETGIRKSTLLELTPNDFDWAKNLLKVKADFTGNKGQVEYSNPISPELQQMLKDYIRKTSIKDDEKIIQFCHGRDKVPYVNQGWVLWRLVKNIGSRCEMGWMYPHALRHTFASHYNQKRKDPFALADAMGDKQVQSVKPYVHTMEDEKKVHAELTKSMFGGDKSENKSQTRWKHQN